MSQKRSSYNVEENKGNGDTLVKTLGGVDCWEFSGMYTGVLGLPTPLWSPRWERTTWKGWNYFGGWIIDVYNDLGSPRSSRP